MNYIVLTSSTTTAFALHDSAVSPYNIMHTPYGRLTAGDEGGLRPARMRLGLYYSQAQDWHHPDGYMAKKDNSQKRSPALPG